MSECLDPSIANEGTSANNWHPGTWINEPSVARKEYQPRIEAPHIPDYAALKIHEDYAKYFQPYEYQPFPAFVYHPTLGEKIVKTKEEVQALGPEWSPTPLKPRVDLTGKSLPVKNDTQRLTEALVENITKIAPSSGGAVDPNMIAAIVAATVAAINNQNRAPVVAASASPPEPEPEPESEPELATEGAGSAEPMQSTADADDVIQRTALLELAEKNGVRIDKRWGNAKLREALGIE